ncbi:MAG: SGNH/GDSL hydrolase family protein [Rhodococcus sp.]|nr:SGNH/GDSL hydrolase family protein [Rhodococcus sp. (in: high G+C Gram-positive bacteria)]
MTSSDESRDRHPGTSQRPVLLVLGDSLSYYGPEGGVPADDPRIWPNIVARELDWDLELVARIGWTSRDAWWALTQDPRVWAAIPRAGAVVLAVGGMDSLPSPLPTPLREQLRYVRPARLRQILRAGYQWMQPRLSPLGWPVALPPSVSVDYLEKIRGALEYVRLGMPIVGTLPAVHNSDAYGKAHPGRQAAVTAVSRWADTKDVPLVDLAAAVHDDIFSGSANPDGIHWSWRGHERVAAAVLEILRADRDHAAGDSHSEVAR